MLFATQDQVGKELNSRNYYLKAEDSGQPKDVDDTVPSFFEKNSKILIIGFIGAFLLAIFPGQSEGGQ